MADTTKGAVEIQRYTAENDPVGSYGHLEPDAAGECVMYDDHARIIATLAAENAALVADARRWQVALEVVPDMIGEDDGMEGIAYSYQIPVARIQSARPRDLLEECIDREIAHRTALTRATEDAK